MMSVPYTALAIANNFVEQFGRDDGIEHMKLQKLVYCSYGWWLAAKGLEDERLTLERPEVWRYGPVFAGLYSALMVFGRRPIREPKSMHPFHPHPNVEAGNTEVRGFIAWIWERYGHLSGFAISELTHNEGSPWHTVAKENNFRVKFNTEIPDSYILKEFGVLLDRRAARGPGDAP